jgi:hypothetical protein
MREYPPVYDNVIVINIGSDKAEPVLQHLHSLYPGAVISLELREKEPTWQQSP